MVGKKNLQPEVQSPWQYEGGGAFVTKIIVKFIVSCLWFIVYSAVNLPINKAI